LTQPQPPYYYPPAAPPEKKDHTLLIVLLVVLVVVVVVVAGIAAVAYYGTSILRTSSTGGNGGGSNSGSTYITAINYQVDYAGSSSGYFGPASQSKIVNQGFAGTTISDTITLTNSALYSSHTVDAIRVTTVGFSIISTTPDLPYTVSAGGDVSITLLIQPPSYSYYGSLGVVISTS
jgi:hypothetical protein